MAMTYTTQIVDEILVVQSEGQDGSLKEVEDFNLSILSEAKKSGCKKVLSDERQLTYNLSLAETFLLGEMVAKKLHFIQAVALVVASNQEEIALFWENVTVNRHVHSRVFLDFDEAIKRLKSINT